MAPYNGTPYDSVWLRHAEWVALSNGRSGSQEPEYSNGLDKHGVEDMRKLIASLRDEGKTIILASHNQTDIDMLCDTICEMDDGTMSRLK